MGKQGQLVVGLTVALFFCAVKVALSETALQSPTPVRDLKVSDIFVPERLGYVTEVHQPEAKTKAPIIIYIQEAHANYEGQQHLAEILEQLVRNHDLKLIMVEGGTGDVGVAHLRSYGPLKHRRQIGQRYLKAGLISAAEYLDLASDYPLTLWGIEEAALYEHNTEAFLNAQSAQEELQPRLAQLRQVLAPLAPKLYEPAMAQLEQARGTFERQETTLVQYAGTLEALALSHGISLAAFPTVRQFLSLRTQEQQLDQAHIEEEQRALLGALSEQLNPEALDALFSQVEALQAGTLSPKEFYKGLQLLLAETQMALTAYPHLAAYVRYLHESSGISTPTLAEELEGLSVNLRERLSAAPQSRQLRELLDAVTLMERMTRFDLSPEDHQQLSRMDLKAAHASWQAFLQAQLPKAGLAPVSLEPVQAFIEAWPLLERFYEVAHQRDDVLVANAAKKLQQSGESLAVMITGGFHAPRMTHLLGEQGIATVVLTPKISHPTDERLYRTLVRFKHGRGGTLESIMHLADATNPQ